MSVVLNNNKVVLVNNKALSVTPQQSKKWERPAEWGLYPLEFQQEKAKEDSERTMEAIYLLYHNNIEKYGWTSSFAGFYTNGCLSTVERGHMVGSTFTVDSTSTQRSNLHYIEQFTASMPEYIVYRITPVAGTGNFTYFKFGHTTSDLNDIIQPVLEVYGRVNIGLIPSNMFTYATEHIDVIGKGTTTSMYSAFNSANSLQCLECTGWDMSRVTSMAYMFKSCTNLVSVDCGGWDTSSVTTMAEMFNSCTSLPELDCKNWDTSSVTTMTSMFTNCHALGKLECNNWDMSSVTDLYNTFSTCSSLHTIECKDWDLRSLTNMGYIFCYCPSLTNIDCSNWNVSSATRMDYMFYQCKSLRTIDCSNWDTSSVTNAMTMFNGCNYTTCIRLKNWKFNSMTNVNSMFASNNRLVTLDCTGWDLTNVNLAGSLFGNCWLLTEFISPIFSKDIQFNSCTKLTHDSLMSIINNLATVTSTMTLTLGSTLRNKLTAEEKAIATNKGWSIT